MAIFAAVGAYFWLAGALRPALQRTARDANAPYGRFFRILPAGARNAADTLFNSANAVAERDALQRETERLRAENLTLKALQAENARLRRELTLARREPRLVCAEVLSVHPGGGWRNLIRVGKGARDGIAPDCAVVSPDGLVGRVSAVTPDTADILLLSDANSRVSCVVEGPGTRGILEGVGAAQAKDDLTLRHLAIPLTVDYLDKDATVRPGMRVMTGGLGGLYPAGVPIGVVTAVRRDDSGLYQTADVAPFVDFSALRRVFIALRSGDAVRRIEHALEDPQP